MTRLVFRILLLTFPRRLRDQVGRPLLQTLIADSHPGGRLSPGRWLAGAWDLCRAGLAARVAERAYHRAPGRGLGGLRDDLVQVTRGLAGRKGFAATVIATLAVGIAVSGTVLTIITTVFVRELPYRDPSRLAFLWTRLAWVGVPRAWVAGPHIDLLDREAQSIEAIVPVRTSSSSVLINGRADVLVAGFTHAPLFDVLGVAPAIGRAFVEADEPRNVAILSHQVWARDFGRRPDIVGASFDVGSDRMEIIGVMPEDFRFLVHSSLGAPRAVDIWLPTRWPLPTMSDGSFGFAALVRIAPHATLAQAQAELEILGKRVDESRFKSRGFGWDLTPIREDLTGSAWAPMRLLGWAAALLFVVVAANMAGLMLTRHLDREREFAVRTALGAPRRDLARLVLLESVALWVTAAAIGLGAVALIVPVLAGATSLPVPRLQELRFDWTVAAGTLAMSALGGLLFGLIPAWRATPRASSMTTTLNRRGHSARTGWARSVLVVAEVALAATLIAGSVLLLRSYRAVTASDPGFRADGVLLSELRLDTQAYPEEDQAVARFRGIIERAAALPGVSAIGGTTSRPLSGQADQAPVTPEGWVPREAGATSIMTDLMRVTPGYLGAIGMSLIEGRDVAWSDRRDGQPVVVIDERLAREAWPDGRAVGRTLRYTVNDSVTATVIGVVRHARQYRYERDDRPQIYVPHAQDTTAFLILALRVDGDPMAVVQPLRDIVSEADPRIPVSQATTMPAVVDDTLLTSRLQLGLVAIFAVASIALAALGVYSVLAAMVHERTRELGIRMALGAGVGAIRQEVFRRMAAVVGAGLVLGGLAIVAMSSVVSPLLFGVTTRDLASYLVTGTLVVLGALLAAWRPIRRATRIDPAIALRAE